MDKAEIRKIATENNFRFIDLQFWLRMTFYLVIVAGIGVLYVIWDNENSFYQENKEVSVRIETSPLFNKVLTRAQPGEIPENSARITDEQLAVILEVEKYTVADQWVYSYNSYALGVYSPFWKSEYSVPLADIYEDANSFYFYLDSESEYFMTSGFLWVTTHIQLKKTQIIVLSLVIAGVVLWGLASVVPYFLSGICRMYLWLRRRLKNEDSVEYDVAGCAEHGFGTLAEHIEMLKKLDNVRFYYLYKSYIIHYHEKPAAEIVTG
ncbi:MAG: hypothetical protein NUV82_03075 [Candidatus Komeilibacteria bacterium]|nr:hypothetical protein [Candidatus Komeilibacteria bacterium]